MNSPYRSPATSQPYKRVIGAAAVSLLGFVGCAGDVIVAEKDMETPEGSPEGLAFEGGGDADDCATKFEERASGYNRWAAAENDFGALESTNWTGDLLFVGQNGGGMEMTLELGQVAGSLALGEQQTLDANLPYPPSDERFLGLGITEGVTFPLRGAQFEGDELVLIVHPTSFQKEWCSLQTPYVDDVNECRYVAYPNVGGGTVDGQPGQCALATDADFVRACTWFHQADYCGCTAEECYAQLDYPDVQSHETAEDYSSSYIVFRLTHDGEASTLTGSAVYLDQEYFVELSLE